MKIRYIGKKENLKVSHIRDNPLSTTFEFAGPGSEVVVSHRGDQDILLSYPATFEEVQETQGPPPPEPTTLPVEEPEPVKPAKGKKGKG